LGAMSAAHKKESVMNNHRIVVLLFLFCAFMAISSVVVRNLISARIRKHYPALWDKLGRPGFLRDSIHSSHLYAGYFVNSNSYKELCDRHINRLVLMARITGWMTGITFVATIAFAYATHTTH